MKLTRVAAALLSVTAGVSASSAAEVRFAPVPVPTADAEKRLVQATRAIKIDGVRTPTRFRTILRSGQVVGNSVPFGQIFDHSGAPLLAEDGSPFISNDNDFSSLLKGADGKLYMVSHFESRPGAMYLTELQQAQNGVLKPLRTHPLDFSAVAGGWVHCAGSVSPWGTHLGSEEYEPDAKQWRDGNVSDYNAAMAAYFGIGADPLTALNPYHYGYTVEVKVDNFDSAAVTKHYAMGRLAVELAYVMPDQKTAYLTDDGTNVGLYRFVAKTPGDLSAGSLWAARWNQTSGEGAGAATLNWIYLGDATDADVKSWTASYKFADIFDEVEPADGACAAGYTSINAGHEDGDHQCLKLRDVNQDGAVDLADGLIASRLETRRWAAMQGATTEFRKMEGVSYNPEARKLYIAMSELDRGMLDFGRVGKPSPQTTYDQGGPNHIRLEQGNVCGAVYELSVDDNYTATDMRGLLSGRPMTTDYGAAAESPSFDGINRCSVRGLANPDNVTYLPGHGTLIIGEDSGTGHQNDMVWSFNLTTRKLTRIETTPYGSETTSPYFYPNINGFAYLMSVVQHPYGESDSDQLESPRQARGYTGYIGPFPAMGP